MDDITGLYTVDDGRAATHLALFWKGRLRYTVPREPAAQKACWELFQPGPLGIPLRAMTLVPRLLGAVRCSEDEKLAFIRKTIGEKAGLSCSRNGAPGPWHKDTIIFMDERTQPLYVAKVGVGAEVSALLLNEAQWLSDMHRQESLIDHIPSLVAHRCDPNFSFVAQSVLLGGLDFTLGPVHIEFLRKLQASSLQSIQFQDSALCKTLHSRLDDLSGLLPQEWSRRLEVGMRLIESAFLGVPIQVVAAHNDFTPWNIRIASGVAKIFDWEYAANEQLPLFDPFHFCLAPMALKSAPTARILRTIHEVIAQCQQSFGMERCYKPEVQALAYMINLCTLYMWADRGTCNSHPSLVSYAHVIDRIESTSAS